jgi:hypothetical protein
MIPTIFDDTDLMLARGKYSTIRAEHEETKQQLQILTGLLTSNAAQILKGVQPADDRTAIDVSNLLCNMRFIVTDIDKCVMRIAELAKQRAELKPTAWPK